MHIGVTLVRVLKNLNSQFFSLLRHHLAGIEEGVAFGDEGVLRDALGEAMPVVLEFTGIFNVAVGTMRAGRKKLI